MTTNVIEIRQLTKDYGNNRGILMSHYQLRKAKCLDF